MEERALQKPSFSVCRRLIKSYNRLKKRLFRLRTVPDAYEKDALETEKQLIAKQIDSTLANTPAEVLKKYKTGARIQPISRLSIKALNGMNVNQIASIRGIGPGSAAAIKRSVQTYVQDVKDDTHLQISYNNQTPQSSKLVKDLYQIDRLNAVSNQAQHMLNAAMADKGLAYRARAAARPLSWLVSRKKTKETALECISQIQKILQTTLITEIDSLEKKRSEILRVQHDTYWGAFNNDPARLYSVLENVKSKRSGKQSTSKAYADLEKIAPELQKQIDRVEVKTAGLNCVLRPYQKIGVQFILNQGNVLLGDEMGLGKTIEAITAMVSLRNSGHTHFAVICPASVLINWKREIQKHSDLKCYVLHGAEVLRPLSEWSVSGGVVITNFENAGKIKTNVPISLTVVDEAHYIKNYSAARTQNTIRVLNQSQRRLLMTGTPIENKLEEMIALLNLLQPDCVRKIYALPQPISRDRFKQIVAPVYFRRTKDAVWKEMPTLDVVEQVLELTPIERRTYIQLIQQRSMQAFTKMRQIAFIAGQDDTSKLQRIREICDEAFENGRKVIIFSFYLDTIDKIGDFLQDSVYGPITGSITPQKRQEIIDAFSAHDGGAVLLSQILAGGTGLNIQAASIVIMCEPQYKPSIENQAIARSYRMGQKNNVTVYRLIGEKTVDERILQVLKEKQALFDAYADKSISGESSLEVKESDIAAAEFAGSLMIEHESKADGSSKMLKKEPVQKPPLSMEQKRLLNQPAVASKNFCVYCGHRLNAGSKFCANCGKSIV